MSAANPPPEALFLADHDVAALADYRSAVEALRAAYAGEITPAMVPPRTMARGPGAWLRSLVAASPSGRYTGCKLISFSAANRHASYLLSLFDQRTSALTALLDANRITSIRTGASAALAVDLLAPRRPLRLGIVGSGLEASGALAALAAVRAFASVRVFSPTAANREAFAERFRASHGLHIAPAASAEQAVAGADVVVCAARSRDETPVIAGHWLPGGTTLVSIGSTLPEQREIDEASLRLASLVVADVPEEVTNETGDLIAAARAGIDVASKTVSLEQLAKGQVRREGDGIAIYKSVGSALQDVVIAEMVLNLARERGAGSPMSQRVLSIAK